MHAVAGQMEAYLRASPLAPLIEAALPAAVPIGVLIAVAEIAIGIGLLTGLAYRAAAWAGFGTSILFWLTASWPIAPYYFSPEMAVVMADCRPVVVPTDARYQLQVDAM